MALIKSISGIRGTIGGAESEGLNPLSISKFTIAFAEFIKHSTTKNRPLIVIGRDARLSGELVKSIVKGTLLAVGCDIIDIGLATTPTTEMAVTGFNAQGGVILTASHNPKEWNALKLLNNKGEFLSKADGEALLKQAENLGGYVFANINNIGKVISEEDYLDRHIDKILELPQVDVAAIRRKGFSVSFDAINSVGGIALPRLLDRLGVAKIASVNSEPTGNFAHNPEPLPQHLSDLSNLVKEQKSDIGFSVDPDVDRLAIYDENGTPFGEEYTLVAVADYMLNYHGSGNTVSNLSSTRALRIVTEQWHKGHYSAAAVGEVNVVEKMKEVNAIIGGEGNGGIIVPALHYGRDALVGIALFLSFLAKEDCSVSELRKRYPHFEMSKQRIELKGNINFDMLKPELRKLYQSVAPNEIDGIKFDFPDSWLHIRSSNTEPILRIYTEAPTEAEANQLATDAKTKIEALLNS